MRLSRLVLALLVGALLFSSGYIVAQEAKYSDAQNLAAAVTSAPAEEEAFAAKTAKDNFEKKMTVEESTQDFMKQNAVPHKARMQNLKLAVSDFDASQEMAFRTLRFYHQNLSRAKSAAQANEMSGEASLQLQSYALAQNARIIELLEQIAKKK